MADSRSRALSGALSFFALMIIVHLLFTSMHIISDISPNAGSIGTAGAVELFAKNSLTTAGVVVAAGTGVAGAAVLTAALPAQMLGAAALSGGLIYAGDRQAKGLPINPFNKEANASTEAPAVEAAV